MLRSLAGLLALVPALALGGERTLVVKTFEDPSHPPNMAVCDAAGFPTPVNVPLGATVWSLQTNAATGAVMNDAIRQIGTATGCGALTNPYPYADKQYFLIRFDLEDGTYVAKGQCDIISYLASNVAIAGCALKIVQAPDGVVTGFTTSSSVLTFGDAPGFATGSIWTLHLYTTGDTTASKLPR